MRMNHLIFIAVMAAVTMMLAECASIGKREEHPGKREYHYGKREEHPGKREQYRAGKREEHSGKR